MVAQEEPKQARLALTQAGLSGGPGGRLGAMELQRVSAVWRRLCLFSLRELSSPKRRKRI